ncbi:MAG: hypothetical protein GWN47_00755 [Woeseiaceae bacterium]|nr:hypothetical protein [Woeseiaceae bacterium]
MAKLKDIQLPNGPTCIVACSATGARLWLSRTRYGEWSFLKEFSDQDAARPEKEFASDRPGRAFDSFGSGRHAMSTSVSGREHEVRQFARQLAQHLNAAIAANEFENIVLFASPAFLGHLRSELSAPARRAVVFEAAKDLTGMDVGRIHQYFT